MPRNIPIVLAALAAVLASDVFAEDTTPAFDPLEMRWTFGAHEPLTMYRRTGRRTTGGIEGSSRWVRPWLDWFDTKSPELMKELGLNWCHARFYKGMGWETEKEDLPNVKRFVDACHRNGVHVLAYMQFSTLYYETMEEEIPDLERWACVDENGKKRIYWSEAYYRWRTCPTCREWEAYVKPIMTIAVTEGGFDGVMFDNCFSEPCYCDRCQQSFREHLAKVPDVRERFGFSNVKHMRQPSEKSIKEEVRDPLVQEWLLWRAEVFQGLFSRLRAHLKSVKPDAVFSANPQPFRRRGCWREFGLDMTRFATLFDIVVAQNGNYPQYDAATGCSRNRIRDLKLFGELGKTAVALCDNDSMLTEEQERFYLLPLVEDLVLGGIPTDRTVVSPVREPGYVSKTRLERRRPLLRRFNDCVRKGRAAYAAPSWQPVRVLYTPTAVMLSDLCDNGLVAAEEILIRRHVPFGYLMSTAEKLEIPSGCEVVVVPNQTCLSEKQVEALVAWAKRGGKLIVTGDSGACDELNRQHFENPLRARLPRLPNVVWRERADELVSPATLAWRYSIPAPKDGGDALLADLKAVGWKSPYDIRNLPEWAAVETKRTEKGYVLHVVNYLPSTPMADVGVTAPGFRVTCETPFDDNASAPAIYMMFRLDASDRAASSEKAPWQAGDGPLVNAHRGSRAEYDDNAAGGFRKCLADGVRGFETDVRLTKDGELVVMHDKDVSRTTCGTGDIHQMTLAEVTALRLKKSGERVPTPQEIAEVFRGVKDVRIEWEMKESTVQLGPERGDLYCNKLYDVVTRTMEPGTFVFTSFSTNTLATMKRLHPDAPTGVITGKPLTREFVDLAAALGCCGVAPRLNGTTKELIDYAHAKGLVTTPWMMQTYRDYAKNFAIGGDTGTSDHAMRLRRKAAARRRLVCLDLDATLCQHRSPIPPENLAALKELMKRYKCIMVGAGNAPRIHRQMDGFPIDIIGNYGMQEAVGEDGSFRIVRAVTNAVDRRFFREKTDYLRKKYGYTRYEGEPLEFHASGMVTFGLLGTAPSAEHKVAFDPDRRKRRAMYGEVCEIFKDYSVFIGGSTSFDFAGKRYNKYDAIMDYAKRNGYALDEIVFVGDDFGDGGGDSHVRIKGMDYIEIEDYRDFPQAVSVLLK